MIVSGVLEVIKKGSKKEYTKRAGKAFIDFPTGVSTNHASEFTRLIPSVLLARHNI